MITVKDVQLEILSRSENLRKSINKKPHCASVYSKIDQDMVLRDLYLWIEDQIKPRIDYDIPDHARIT